MKDKQTYEKTLRKKAVKERERRILRTKEIAALTGKDKLQFDIDRIEGNIKSCEYDLKVGLINTNAAVAKLAMLKELHAKKIEEIKNASIEVHIVPSSV